MNKCAAHTKRAAPKDRPFLISSKRGLLDFDGAAGANDLGSDFVGFSLRDAFLDRLRSGFHQRLGFGQAERGDRADFLDDGDLVAAVAGQDDVEFGLFFDSFGSSATASRGSNGNSSSGGNAPCFFEGLGKVSRLEDGQLRKFFNKLGDIGHDVSLQIDVAGTGMPRRIVECV